MFKTLVFSLGAVAFVMTTPAQAIPRVTVESPLPWLQILPNSNAQFRPLVQQAFTTAIPDTLTPVLPSSVLLKNDGTVTLTGIAVRFAITTAGKTVYRDFNYYNFPRTTAALGPGQSLIMTPFRDTNDVAHKRSTPFIASDPVALSMLGAADSIHVTVDLVVSADGRTAGPDTALTLSKMKDQAQGHHDLVAEFVGKNGGASDTDLVTWLTDRIKNPLKPGKYGDIQKSIAQVWIAQIKNGHRDTLTNSLVRFSSGGDTTLTFLNSLKGGLK